MNPDPLYVEDEPVMVTPPDLGDSPTYWTDLPRRRDFALVLCAAGIIAIALFLASPILTRVV